MEFTFLQNEKLTRYRTTSIRAIVHQQTGREVFARTSRRALFAEILSLRVGSTEPGTDPRRPRHGLRPERSASR